MISDERLSFIDRNPDMFYPDYVELARGMMALRRVGTWTRCDNRLPEDDTLCLAIDEDGVIWTAHYDGGELRPDIGGMGDVPFTHWLPMPEAPND